MGICCTRVVSHHGSLPGYENMMKKVRDMFDSENKR